jgi:hypothetical protein
MALAMKGACERCNAALPIHAGDAWICSHECTFCGQCADEMSRRCPNCGGELVARPRRLPAGGATEILDT